MRYVGARTIAALYRGVSLAAIYRGAGDFADSGGGDPGGGDITDLVLTPYSHTELLATFTGPGDQDYNEYRIGTGEPAVLGASGVFFGLLPDTSYTAQVRPVYIGAEDPEPWSNAATASTDAMDAPAIAFASADGANPPEIDVTTSTYFDPGTGYKLIIQIGEDGGFVTHTEIEEDISLEEWITSGITITDFDDLTGGETYWFRACEEDPAGNRSPWSNVLSDLLDAADATPQAWDPAKKSTGGLLSSFNHVATGDGSWMFIGSVTGHGSGVDEVYAEVTVGTIAGQLYIGVANDDATWGPGWDGDDIYNHGASWAWYGDLVSVTAGNFSCPAMVAGDIAGLKLNKATRVVTFYQNGTPIGTRTVPGTSDIYVAMKTTDGSVVTINTGDTAFANLPSGATAWG